MNSTLHRPGNHTGIIQDVVSGSGSIQMPFSIWHLTYTDDKILSLL
jgi:hypothetical protein